MADYLSWVEVDKRALILNISSLRKLLNKNTKFLAVVKGNAYGHGIEEVASVIKDQVDWFGGNNLDEALVLKKLGIRKPILILGYTQNSRLTEVIQNGFRQVVFDTDTIKTLIQLINQLDLKGKVKVHLKIETGTNRQGVEDAELLEISNILKKSQVEIEGASMHFATLEEEENAFYKHQLKRFQSQLKLLQDLGIDPEVKHTASTAAATLYPETYLNMVRIGIGLYGLWPSELTKQLAISKKINIDLQPVLTWKTKIAQIKNVQKGETIGYGRTYKVKKKMKIAILPVGYFDGYDRHLSNNSRVLLKDQFAPVIGRVMMNMIIVDVSNIKNIKVEDEVILIGRQGKSEITAEEIADRIGTINYEVVARINPQIPRLIV